MRSPTGGIAALSVLMALAGCVSTRGASHGVNFVLVRHAEKAADDPRDPSLSTAGVDRARRLARRLHGEPVVAVYSTKFRRTQQTATPTAVDHALPVTDYDASEPAEAFAARLRNTHDAGTVLVVGHSNTVPALAQALCSCTIDPIAEDGFGRRISITLLPDGRATVDDRDEP